MGDRGSIPLGSSNCFVVSDHITETTLTSPDRARGFSVFVCVTNYMAIVPNNREGEMDKCIVKIINQNVKRDRGNYITREIHVDGVFLCAVYGPCSMIAISAIIDNIENNKQMSVKLAIDRSE